MSAPDHLTGGARVPLAYLITFRCYGTWLHGDERGSTDRHHNRYGTPFIPPDEHWRRHNTRTLRYAPVELDTSQRAAVEASIRETCVARGWALRAVNVRTNHVHAVVSAGCQPERLIVAFKANATHKMRGEECWPHEHSPWSEGGSRRYLWAERNVERAVEYVMYGQGDRPPNFD